MKFFRDGEETDPRIIIEMISAYVVLCVFIALFAFVIE
jgi:hypothetical protein